MTGTEETNEAAAVTMADYTDDRPPLSAFAEKWGIAMTAKLAAPGATPIGDRETNTNTLYRRWYDYFFPKWGGVRKLDRSKLNGTLNRATAKDKGYIYVADPLGRDMIDLALTFTREERSHTIAYAVGIGHCKASYMGHDPYDLDQLAIYVQIPTLASVLDSLAMEARSVTDALTFEEWASEFGYDTDSRKAEKVYQLCQQQAAALRLFLGHPAFADLTGDNYQPE